LLLSAIRHAPHPQIKPHPRKKIELIAELKGPDGEPRRLPRQKLSHKDLVLVRLSEVRNARAIGSELNETSFIDFPKTNQRSYDEIATQLGAVLAFLHKNGYVHGDINAPNVLIVKHFPATGKPLVVLSDNETITKTGELHIQESKLPRSTKKLIFDTQPFRADPEIDKKNALKILERVEKALGLSRLREKFSKTYDDEMRTDAQTFRGGHAWNLENRKAKEKPPRRKESSPISEPASTLYEPAQGQQETPDVEDSEDERV
jgi:hypothetical protein